MHLYEINTEIALLMQQLEVDEDTGEILTSSEAILQQLNALDMERSRTRSRRPRSHRRPRPNSTVSRWRPTRPAAAGASCAWISSSRPKAVPT